jgi:hypothetical protein
MRVNARPLQGAIESSKRRFDFLKELAKANEPHPETDMLLNEIGVLYTLFQTLGEAVADLQKENNSYQGP